MGRATILADQHELSIALWEPESPTHGEALRRPQIDPESPRLAGVRQFTDRDDQDSRPRTSGRLIVAQVRGPWRVAK